MIDELEKAFRKYTSWMIKNSDKYRFICIDGKTLKNSFDKFTDQKAKHILYAFLHNERLILAHEEVTKDKTNEIPQMQKMVKKLSLDSTNTVYTPDAIHAQEKTMKQIKKQKCDFIIQVKANQKKLLRQCQLTGNNRKSIDENISFDKKSGRVEERKVRVFENLDFLNNKWKRYVKTVVKLERKRRVIDSSRVSHKDSYDESYYVSSKFFNARKFNESIRGHRAIENSLNYVKDVIMGEDRSRIRKNPEVMAILKDIALNILRLNDVKNINTELFENCQNLSYIYKYKFI